MTVLIGSSNNTLQTMVKKYMKNTFDPNTLASGLVDLTCDISPGQEFNRDTIHLFCSPLFLNAMRALYDKNIRTISCGSGKERGIAPGITCDFNSLTPENQALVKHLIISPGQFRIGANIEADTTFAEFEKQLMKTVDILKQQAPAAGSPATEALGRGAT